MKIWHFIIAVMAITNLSDLQAAARQRDTAILFKQTQASMKNKKLDIPNGITNQELHELVAREFEISIEYLYLNDAGFEVKNDSTPFQTYNSAGPKRFIIVKDKSPKLEAARSAKYAKDRAAWMARAAAQAKAEAKFEAEVAAARKAEAAAAGEDY